MTTTRAKTSRPWLAFTQGDPAGIGPEILAHLALKSSDARSAPRSYHPLLVAEASALRPLRSALPRLAWDRLRFFTSAPRREQLEGLPPETVVVLDPCNERRAVQPGEPGPADAAGAMAALDLGVALVRDGVADALVTAPVAKAVIARHHLPGFVGHTDYLAAGCGLERYGRDYLMVFLTPDLQVALLSTHIPLSRALRQVCRETVEEALLCLYRNGVRGKIAVAGLNPHAGEGGLLGTEDDAEIAPAVAAAVERGQKVLGPESADSLFARARGGEMDWVLALYHDQGLIAVKTAAFGMATNWTLGLPYVRTSVDHGTAFAIAGQGKADIGPLRVAAEAAVGLLRGDLPRG